MTYWKSPSFKALQLEWYRRLQADGFQDAETFDHDDLVLKRTSTFIYQGLVDTVIRAKESYYALLGQMVEEYDFKDPVDKLILTWHSQGKKITEICTRLDVIQHSRARNTVRFIIRRYEIEWGLKSYKPNQLNKYQQTRTP